MERQEFYVYRLKRDCVGWVLILCFPFFRCSFSWIGNWRMRGDTVLEGNIYYRCSLYTLKIHQLRREETLDVTL